MNRLRCGKARQLALCGLLIVSVLACAPAPAATVAPPTQSPVATPRAPQPSATPAPTATSAATPAPTPSPTQVPSPDPTPTPSPTASRSPTPTLAPSLCPNGCSEPPSECTIKGNIAVSGEKIYHLPGQRFYADTVINPERGERWFCTEAEARANGWRKSLQ